MNAPLGLVARGSRAPFVGRTQILKVLETERVVLLRAEPGAGKSRLLSEARAKAGGALAVAVRCHRGVASVHEPLEAIVAAAHRATPGSSFTRPPGGNDADRLLSIRERLELLAASRPLLLQIDDLHFAPQETLTAIAFCVDRTRDSTIRWQFATRPAAANEAALDAMRRDDDCIVVDVPPLDEGETAQLARALGATKDAAMHRLTGGNPLYLEQWIAARVRPEAALTLRSTLDARLAELSAKEADLAAILAVANRPMSIDEAVTTAGGDPAAVRATVTALAASGIVHAESDWFEFGHDLLRDACYDALEPARRAGLHEQLLAIARDDGERANHFEGAGRHDEAASAYLTRIRRALEDLSFSEAGALADRVARLSPISSAAQWQLEATRLVITTARGTYTSDLGAWNAFIARGSVADADTRAFYLERLVGVVGRPAEPAAVRCLETALNDPDVGPDMRALLLTWRVRELYDAFELDGALAAADHALAISDPDSDTRFQLRALRAMTRAHRHLEESRTEFRELTDSRYKIFPSYTFAFVCAATAENRANGREATLAWAKAGAVVSDVRKSRGLFALWTFAAIELGRITEALEVCSAATAYAVARGGIPTVSQAAWHVQALVWAGDLERGQATLDRTRGFGVPAHDVPRLEYAAAMLQEARGEREAALARYEFAASPLDASVDSFVAIASACVVRLTSLAGEARRAREELQRLRAADARALFADHALAEAEFYVALSESEHGSFDTARAAYDRMTALDVPVLPRAVALAHLGERAHDRAALLEAIAVFDAARAVAFAERTRAVARKLGFRPGSKPASKATLTAREADVVQAIAEGKTNREIAEELHVSSKTVAACVSGILLKCGLRSRVEIAAQVASGKPFVRV